MAHDEQAHTDGWQTFSDWIDGHRGASDISRRLDEDASFKSKLVSSQSNKERFQLLWSNEELRQEVTNLYKQDAAKFGSSKRTPVNRLVKSPEYSKQMRDQGNDSFKRARYSEALKRYTQAVRFAPYPKPDDTDNSLALALANRSAALYALKKYRLCLLDIDLAMKYKYPEANKFKLLIRKVKCLHILSVWANDVEQIKADLRAKMRRADTPDYIKTELGNMFEFLEQTQPEDVDKDESDVEDETIIKISNVSKSLPQAADCVEMSCDPDKGRYLLTNKDVSFGRLLVAEDPYVCNLAPSKRDRYCYHCFGRLYCCGLACNTCTRVLYCSLDCLDKNKQIHNYECGGLLDFHEEIGIVYLVTHIMFKIDFNLSEIPVHSKKTVEMKKLDDILEITHSNWPDLVYKNDYAAVLSLMDHAPDLDYDEMMSYTLTAVYLTIAFSQLFPEKIDGSEDMIGPVLLRHILQLQTNSISILDQNFQSLVAVGHSIDNAKEKPIGVGLYPTIALLNHSCQPNILSMFHRNKFIARASSSLDCGTEISYCYGPNIRSMSKSDRQRHLKAQYFFTCCCDCCANDKEDHGRALVCPECRGPIVYNQDLSHKCMDCKRENSIDVKNYLGEVNTLKCELDKIEARGDPDPSTLRRLKLIEKSLTDLVHWRNPVFVKVKSQLIECAQEISDLEAAIEFCKEELELTERTFGENTIESIMTKMKYVNLDWQRLYYKIEDARDSDSKKAALEELKTLAQTVTGIRGKLKDLLNSTSIMGAESTFDNELKFLSTLLNNINKHLASSQEAHE